MSGETIKLSQGYDLATAALASLGFDDVPSEEEVVQFIDVNYSDESKGAIIEGDAGKLLIVPTVSEDLPFFGAPESLLSRFESKPDHHPIAWELFLKQFTPGRFNAVGINGVEPPVIGKFTVHHILSKFDEDVMFAGNNAIEQVELFSRLKKAGLPIGIQSPASYLTHQALLRETGESLLDTKSSTGFPQLGSADVEGKNYSVYARVVKSRIDVDGIQNVFAIGAGVRLVTAA